jgi:hypothetical protein
MNIEQSAVILVGTLLASMSLLIIIATAIAINRLFHKFWKPVSLFTPESWKGFDPPEHVTKDKS